MQHAFEMSYIPVYSGISDADVSQAPLCCTLYTDFLDLEVTDIQLIDYAKYTNKCLEFEILLILS